MAEAAGLALGVVALASLFNSCVEFLEYLDSGRDHAHEFHLACTKVSILHQRLRLWGCSLRLEATLHEHPGESEYSEREAISKGLQELRSVLIRAEELRRKYDVKAGLYSQRHRGGEKAPSWPVSLRRRTTWSVRDRKKFGKLIEDIAFLVDNLEKVSRQSDAQEAMSDRAPRQSLKDRQLAGQDSEKKISLLEGAQSDEGKASDGLSCRPTDRLQLVLGKTKTHDTRLTLVSKTHRTSSEQRSLATPQMPEQEGKKHKIGGEQINEGRSVGVHGVVEPGPSECEVTGVQRNSQLAFGFMGAVGAEAMLEMVRLKIQAQKE